MALTAEDIQKQLEDYFNSDEGKSYLDDITANISDEYTESEGGGYVSYGDISLEDWQEQNIVTNGNNNTSLSNDQLTQIKTFAAMQPKYNPIKVGGGMGSEAGSSSTSEADRIRSAELKKTPGPIYTNFAAYSKALQDHNKKIKTYVEDNKIPTSITTPDGTKLELNLGLTPAYYQEQRDGGRLQNVLHMNTDQGYYTQLGGVGQYGSYHRPTLKRSTSFVEHLKTAAPFFAAFVGVAILGPMAAKYVGSTGMGQFLSTASSKIITAVKNAPATFAGIFGKEGAINATFQNLLVSAGADAAIAEKVTLNLLGSIAATSKGISYAEQYLDEESRAALEAAAASATGANGLPGAGTYSGPGAGPNGEVDPNVIYNFTTGAAAGADATEDEDDDDGGDATAIVNAAVAAVTTPDEDDDVVTATTAVNEAETALNDATNTVATVVKEETAKADGVKSYADYVCSRYGPRSFSCKSAGKRADKAQLEAQNKINKARTKESAAIAEYEDRKKAAIGVQRDAEDEYKKAVAQARREAEEEARAEAKAAAEARAAAKEAGISEAQDGYSSVAESAGTYDYDSPTVTTSDAVEEVVEEVTEEAEEAVETAEEPSAEEVQEAKDRADQIITDAAEAAAEETEAPDYTEVEATPDGADALPADEQEIEEQATTPPVDEEIKEDIEEPPKYPEKEEEVVEETKTDDGGGGSGGGGAGEGAGAGQGGDTGADAEVGTTTTAETGEAGAADTKEAKPPVTATEEPYTGDDSYMPADQVIARQLYNAYLQETDIELKGKILKEYQNYAETTLPPDEAFGVWTEARNEAARAAAEAAEAAAEAARYTSGMEAATGDAAETVGQWVQLVNGAWKNTVTGKIAAPTAVSGGSGEGEWEVLNPDGTGTGEIINEYSDDTGAESADDINIGLPTDEDTKEEAAGTTGAGEETGTTTTTDTGTTTTTTTTGTDATSTATTSTGTAGATTTPTETTTGGAGTNDDLGTSDTTANEDQAGAGADGAGTGTTGPADEVGAGDADATGAGAGDADATGSGTGASGTPGAGAGDEGDPGDVGEGTGTGAGTGTGTGGGTGSGTGTGTGSGEGAGEGSGTGGGEGEGEGEGEQQQQQSQGIMPLMQTAFTPVTVKGPDPAKIGPAYDFESIFRDPVQDAFYRGPYSQGSANEELLRLIGDR